MKKHGFSLSLLPAVLAFVASVSLASAEVVDRIVAVVNGEIITLQELDEQVARSASGPDGAGAIPADARARFLDLMINDILLRQEAERLKIEVTDSEVENEIRQFKVRRRLTDEQFENSLKLQGMTLDQFKARTRQDVMKHRMIGFMVRRKVVVTQEEVAAYFEQHRGEFTTGRSMNLQMLVLGDAQSAASVRADVEGGRMSFDDAVRSRSIGPREDNGVITGVGWGELSPDWQAALESVAIGGTTQPFPVQGKWVVLKVLDRKEGMNREFAEAQEEVREVIMRPKLEARFQEYMTDLRSKALIEKRL